MRYIQTAAVILLCAGPALAFQLQPKYGWRRHVSESKRKLPTYTSVYASGFADDSDTASTAGTAAEPSSSAASSAFDDMLEKFALPLEFKSVKDNAKVDAAADKVDEKVAGDKTNDPLESPIVAEKATVSTDNSKTSSADAVTQKAEDKKEQSDNTPVTESKVVQKEQNDNKKVQVTDSDAKVIQKADEKKEQVANAVVEKVDDKKEQVAKEVVQNVEDKTAQSAKEETKVVQMVDEKKEVAPKQEEAPAASTATPFGPIVTPRRAFSDFGAPQRAEPKIKWDFGEETKMKPTALGVNPNRKTEVVKMEEPETITKQPPSSTPKKELDTTSVTEAKAAPKTSDLPAKDSAKDTSKSVIDEKSSVVKSAPPSTEIAPPTTSSDVIKTQPMSLPSVNLPESLRNINLEDPAIIASGTVVLGIALYVALVQNMNKNDKATDEEDQESEPEPNLIQKVKDAGVAGAISYAFWELGFWGISIPICVVGYNKFTGHWPDLSNSEDMKQLGGEIFAFANVARLAVPLRIGLALSTVPWVEENIVQKFRKEENDAQQEVEMEEMEDVVLEEQVDMSNEDEDYLEWSGDDWQEGEMGYGYEGNENEWQEEMTYADEGNEVLSQWSDFEERLSIIEANAIRVASVLGQSQNDQANSNSERMASLPGSGYLNYIDEYCEPGTRSSNCAGALKGYLDGLASTGAVASDREVSTIVGYLDSLSSNTTPSGPSRTGAAFTTYLDALSSGNAPSPPSAEAVAGYLDDLTVSSPEGSVGTRVVDIEGRLNKLESSISSLPDDIASRIISWQDSQDKKLSEEIEKIQKMLEDVKS